MAMDEPEAMKQIHKIREKNYHETKNMSPDEYTQYIRKKASEVAELRKRIKPPKNLKKFFAELNNRKKAS